MNIILKIQDGSHIVDFQCNNMDEDDSTKVSRIIEKVFEEFRTTFGGPPDDKD
jgi:hypothetical protein